MRIRTVKPEFWRTDRVAQVGFDHRLLLIGLYSYVDDNGVGVDDARQIAADLFALEDDPLAVREWVREGVASLSRASLITRYRVDDAAYLYVNDWQALQRIHNPNKPRFPTPDEATELVPSDDAESESAFASISREDRDSVAPGVLEQGRYEQGSHDSPCSPSPRDEASTRSTSSTSTPERFDEFWSIYPKRVGKQAAIKAWKKAIKLADVETILDGARRYRDERSDDDPTFTAHPSTWLNQGRWDDEPQPKPNRHLRAVTSHQGWRNPDDPAVYDEPLLPSQNDRDCSVYDEPMWPARGEAG